MDKKQVAQIIKVIKEYLRKYTKTYPAEEFGVLNNQDDLIKILKTCGFDFLTCFCGSLLETQNRDVIKFLSDQKRFIIDPGGVHEMFFENLWWSGDPNKFQAFLKTVNVQDACKLEKRFYEKKHTVFSCH